MLTVVLNEVRPKVACTPFDSRCRCALQAPGQSKPPKNVSPPPSSSVNHGTARSVARPVATEIERRLEIRSIGS